VDLMVTGYQKMLLERERERDGIWFSIIFSKT
jgi:hypothetical protein